MATFFAVRKSVDAEGSLRARVANAFGAFKRRVDEDILRQHDEDVLHSLDKRILDDAGIGRREEETKPEDCRNQSGTLRTLFSLTRFAK